MKKFLLFSLLFLISCSSNTHKDSLIFYDNMSFEEFKQRLEEYAKIEPYPDIDE